VTATLPVRRSTAPAAHRAGHRARPARARTAPARPRPAGAGTPRRALVHFALAGVATVLLIAIGGAFVSRAAAEDQALGDAQRVNGVVARTVVEPHLRDALLTGDPAALAEMRTATARLIDGPVLRMKLWAPDGRIVYSDEERLIGQQYPLEPDEAEVLVTGDAAAEISDVGRDENSFERDLGTLLEVYRPVHTPSGQVLLFETYMPLSSLSARTTTIWLQFLPITVGALVLLSLVQFPLAARLARQTGRARREREIMLNRSLAASDAERRRIAADLHDGVVQDLAATSIALAGAAVAAGREGRPDESGRLALAAEAVRAGIRSLRSLVVDIHPPNLRRMGLASALGDLTAAATARGVPATLVVDDGADGRLGSAAEQFAFRAAQEALRNVVSHSGARAVEVRLGRRRGAEGADLLTLTVTDDGVGFERAAVAPDDRPRMGLRLLDDLAGDVGGRIDVRSAPGAGTTVRMEVPVG
jgi:two-component system, NarL family, sensor kinase